MNRRFRLFQLPFQKGKRVVRRLNGGQFRPPRVQIRDHLFHRGAVLLFQTVQKIASALHRVQFRRGKVKFRSAIPDRLRQIVHFAPRRVQPLPDRRQIAAEVLNALDGILRLLYLSDGPRALVVPVQIEIRAGKGGEIFVRAS